MSNCKHCGEQMSPSKKGVKSFCNQKCRAGYWYDQNRQITIDRAASWRKDNNAKMKECRKAWNDRNRDYATRRKTANARLAEEAIYLCLQYGTYEDRLQLAFDILDLKLGLASTTIIEDFLTEVLDE